MFEDLISSEAVRLFVDRARSRLPAFELDSENAGAMASVCRELDGIPLAIELSTARMGALAVEQIVERLEGSLKLLSGGDRTVAESFIGHLFKTIGKHVPPPPGLTPPPLWGTEDRLRELFGDGVSSVEATGREYRFVYPSAEHFVGYFREYYGPTLKAFEALDARGQETLAGEIEELTRSWNRTGDETAVVPSYYLEVVALKR